ncbi:MAG: hypothetical protein ACYCOO_09900 [Chitinophagaceae bacterium]
MMMTYWRLFNLLISPIAPYAPSHLPPSFPGKIVLVRFTQDEPPQDSLSDTLYYSYRKKLSWKDFTGKKRLAGDEVASTYSSFEFWGSIQEKKDTLFIVLSVQVFLIKSASWVEPDGENSYDLQHEQDHFDLTKIAAEYFITSVKRAHLNATDYTLQLNALYFEAFRYMNQIQSEYDEQTEHGINTQEQKNWNIKVATQIKKLQINPESPFN